MRQKYSSWDGQGRCEGEGEFEQRCEVREGVHRGLGKGTEGEGTTKGPEVRVTNTYWASQKVNLFFSIRWL